MHPMIGGMPDMKDIFASLNNKNPNQNEKNEQK